MEQAILFPDGKTEELGKCHDQELLILAGKTQRRERDKTIEAACKAGLVAQDPISEKGLYTFLPRGAIMYHLLEDYIFNIHAKENAFFMKTPVLCDYSHPAVKLHSIQSGDGAYHTENETKLIMKQGALYTQFEFASKKPLKESQLPLRIFEMAPCHRIDKFKAVAPLRRHTNFTMLDMHVICRDMEQAKEESKKWHEKTLENAKDFGWEFRSTYTIDEEFFKQNKEWVKELCKREGKPVLVKPANPEKGRALNLEFSIVTPAGAVEVAAFIIDVGNPKRFKIKVDTEKGEKTPVIVHVSVVGSVERWIYAIVQKAIEKNKNLPKWLAPEQIRFIPENQKETVDCLKQAEILTRKGFRATVDDRQTSSREKIESAKNVLVPLIVYKKNDKYILEQKDIKPREIIEILENATLGKPKKMAAFPTRLSQWPEFLDESVCRKN